MFNQLGVIGCGLMGGSFALALKRAGLVKRVIGYSKSPSTTERAKKLGGSILQEAIPVPGIGTFSIIQDPQKAVIAMFEGASPAS